MNHETVTRWPILALLFRFHGLYRGVVCSINGGLIMLLRQALEQTRKQSIPVQYAPANWRKGVK